MHKSKKIQTIPDPHPELNQVLNQVYFVILNKTKQKSISNPWLEYKGLTLGKGDSSLPLFVLYPKAYHKTL